MSVQEQAPPEGSLKHRKARWVIHGFKQWPGMDFNQTCSRVIKPVTIHTILHLATARNSPVH
jgi:ssRNA-specific RNase YbeY (16S rRNA maturation enzyme)